MTRDQFQNTGASSSAPIASAASAADLGAPPNGLGTQSKDFSVSQQARNGAGFEVKALSLGAPSELAAGCLRVSNGQALALEVCTPSQDPEWAPYANFGTSVLALIASFAAVYVAHRTLGFTQTQSRQARAQYVRDEYWLRTVVSPTSIEPFQLFMAQLRIDLPGAMPPFVSPSSSQLQAFFTSTAREFNDFSFKFQCLALIDASLSDEVAHELELIEDGVAAYIGALQTFVSGAILSPPDRDAALAGLTSGMLRLFKKIQDYQHRQQD